MLNPNQGYKKLVQKLKAKYKVSCSYLSCRQCSINKDELTLDKLSDYNLVMLGNPREPFNAAELKHLKEYVTNGGKLLVLLGEGGESKNNTNINFLLEQFNISVNSDSVVRTMYHNYHHPKECFVSHGMVNKEFLR